ncbi:uncharacterized protein FA14DRAFT_159081 [Meira miltonrushii]|uniref:BSD domain-containing protein n=1 Tax=Meira miltonrushii TaxID=1280837 RepID=A0A316VHX6_9BASI|nr:uncharacterized protein FA14DRAFT_159081 [Meira miltonrushii]PWN36638.1 hypothetical protein FA14DRAFT_159081 [Meira miltonrushii]
MSAAATSSEAFLHAAVSYSKLPGTLSMERNGILRWTPSSSSAASSALAIDEKTIVHLQVSAEGQKQVAMVLQLAEGITAGPDGKNKIFFYFTGGIAGNEDRTKASSERNAFKNYLAEVVSQNKNRQRASAVPSPGPARAEGSATPAAVQSDPSKSRGTPSGVSTPMRKEPTKQDGPSELEVRIRVLKANPSLAVLHQDVVMSGQITDQEFWAHPTRRALLNAERASMQQKQGRNARIADPRPTANESGEMKINMTPELVRDLKAQYPVVARAFEENVPSVMDEPTFWKRYFSSKLYHRLRTSARSQASQHTVQADDVFDKYLVEEDDGLEPRREYNAHDAFLDLGATAEDHGETGNEKDWTMRAGVERKTLPLMRRFNDHSQSLLDSALGEQDEAMRRKRKAKVVAVNEDSDDDADDGVRIEELEEQDERKRRKLLNVQQGRSLFDRNSESGQNTAIQRNGSAKDTNDEVELTDEQIKNLVEENVAEWTNSLDAKIQGRSKQFSSAMSGMLENVHARKEARAWRKAGSANEIPESILKQMMTQNASTTEFLRQFWAAIAPQPLQDGTLPTTAANSAPRRKARAQRMITSLQTSQERFKDILANSATSQSDVRAQRIASAITPTQTAVKKALNVPVNNTTS